MKRKMFASSEVAKLKVPPGMKADLRAKSSYQQSLLALQSH